jgi:SEC-C motif-containing protein
VPEDFDKIPKERHLSLCPCKSKKSYQDCSLAFHQNKALPKTAEALMRSRYSVFFFRLPDYLVETTHPDTRSENLQRELEDTIHHTDWLLGVCRTVE